MSVTIFNQQELLYLSRLLSKHADKLERNEEQQINQEKFGFVDNQDFAKTLSIKTLQASIKAPQVEEKPYEIGENDNEPLIENWDIVDNMVFGNFYNRDYAPNGIQSHTSLINSIDGDYIYTQNSKYRLGKKEESPHSWIKKVDTSKLLF